MIHSYNISEKKMQPTTKDFEYTGTAGDIFMIFLWTTLFMFLSIFGSPLAMRKTGKILTSKMKVNGRSLDFDVEYWEAFKFILIQNLLIFITFGIYYFWFIRNSYRFSLAHTHFADSPIQPAQVPQPTQVPPPVPPSAPITPQFPTNPVQ